MVSGIHWEVVILLDYQVEMHLVKEDHTLCKFLLGGCCAYFFSTMDPIGSGNG